MSRRIAIAAALLLQLLGVSLAAQDNHSLDEALALLRRGVAEAGLGDVDRARSSLTDAAEKMRAQNDGFGTWMAYLALAHVENAVGRPKEAIVPIQKALALIDDPESMIPRNLQEHVQPITHDLYGSLLTQTGQLEKAELELNEACAGSRGAYECSIVEHFGDLRFRQQRYDEARVHYQEALRGLAAGEPVLLLNRRSVMAGIEARLGNLELSSRNYGAASSHLERSLQLYQLLNDSPAQTGVWGDLCLVYIELETYAVAEDVLARARERIGNKSELGDDMLAFIATLLRFYRREATVEELKASAERFIRHVPAEEIAAATDVRRIFDYGAMVYGTNDFSRPEVPLPNMRLAAGMQQLQKGNLEMARTIWREALGESPDDTDRATLVLMIGVSHFMEGNVEQASRWLTEGITAREAGIDDLRSEDMVMKYLGDQGPYFTALIESLVFSGKIEQSFEAAERARARAFLRLLGNRRLKLPADSDLVVVRRAAELRRKIDNWDNDRQPDTTLADLRQQYQAILPRVQVVAGEYLSLTSVPAQSIDAVRKALPENTTLLSYYVTPFSAHAWILDKETLEHVRLPISESKMRRISCWAFDLTRPRSGRAAESNGCGVSSADPGEAYAALIAPLRSKIRKERLMIVPHGDLHYVPFAALYHQEQDQEQGRYLIEDYPITYVPSASTIRFLREKESPVDGGVLVLGDPAKANLGGAGREARKVARKLRTTAKLGEEARESLLYQLNGKVDLLHIAAHGTYDATSPLFSAIHLAEGKGRNGQLNVDEIQSELDLSGVNLVVLSACKSGVGKRSGGDEIIGLTRAILYAGSPGVIATLWNISDAATPPLIEKFYDHLLAGATAADALRAAQTELLRHPPDPKLKDPRFWAAFFLTGDPQGNWKRSGR